MKPRWHIYPDSNDLCERATAAIARIANHCIISKESFHVVLAGGTTPKMIYQRLRDIATDWSAWHIYFGDERCLPENDVERNSVMAYDALLQHVAIPKEQIYIIPAELGADAAAQAYTCKIESIFLFDLVLLGLGEDGHTASLFPGQDWGIAPDSPAVLAVHGAPKSPSERVSLSARRLSAAEQVLFLVTGLSKRQAVSDWFTEKNIPLASVAPPNGVDVFMEDICFKL